MSQVKSNNVFVATLLNAADGIETVFAFAHDDVSLAETLAKTYPSHRLVSTTSADQIKAMAEVLDQYATGELQVTIAESDLTPNPAGIFGDATA